MGKKTLNVEKYIALKNEGLQDVDIAKRFFCSKAYVSKIKAKAIKKGYTSLQGYKQIVKEVDTSKLNLEDKAKIFLDNALSRKWVNEKHIVEIAVALIGLVKSSK